MMRITFNGEQVNFAINHRIPQKYWNAKLSKSSKGYEGSKELNRFLQDLQFRAFDAFTTLEREEDDFTAKRIHDVMNGIGVESSRYILDLWKEQVQDVKSRVGKNIAHTTTTTTFASHVAIDKISFIDRLCLSKMKDNRGGGGVCSGLVAMWMKGR